MISERNPKGASQMEKLKKRSGKPEKNNFPLKTDINRFGNKPMFCNSQFHGALL